MKNEITDLLSELMISDDADLSNCLRKEQEKLDEIKCTTPETGKWVDDFELPVLFEILDSPDSYFYKHFPELKSLSYEKRRQLAEDIQKHVEICEHCKLKINYDTNWEIQVNSVVEQNRKDLKDIDSENKDSVCCEKTCTIAA